MQLKGILLLRCCWFGVFVSSEEGSLGSGERTGNGTQLQLYAHASSVCEPETELSIHLERAT
jgi:hypothetical protein